MVGEDALKIQNRLVNCLTTGAILLALLTVQGCATYGKSISDVRNEISIGNIDNAEIALKKSIKKRGDDRLLYFLESGMLQHFQGNYQDSNRLLEEAYLIIDPVNSVSFSDRLQGIAFSPRQATYRGNDFERSMISFIKLLNFINLSNNSDTNFESADWLESARVEARRIRIALDLAESKTKARGDNSRSYRNGSSVDSLLSDMLENQTSAPVVASSIPMLDWITAVIYEMLGEQDNARIATERSINGYSQSYGHSPVIDLGMVENNGHSMESGYGDLMLVQMTGLIPEQSEFSVFTGMGGLNSSLYFSPSYSSHSDVRFEQSIWFNSVLGQPNGYQLWLGHAAGKRVINSKRKFKSKIHYNNVSPGYFESNSLLLNVLIQGFRIALSYYPSSAYLIDSESTIHWQGNQYQSTLGFSLARKVVEDHAAYAWREFYLAFAREFFQQLIAEQLYQSTKDSDSNLGALLGVIGKVGAFAGAQADTRSWLTLPREIQVMRISLPQGQQSIDIETRFRRSGNIVRQTVDVNINAGKLNFVSLYTADMVQN